MPVSEESLEWRIELTETSCDSIMMLLEKRKENRLPTPIAEYRRMANGNLILKWNQKTKYNNVESFLRKLVGGRWNVLKRNKRIVYPESKALRRPAASLCMRRPAAGASPQLPQEETTVVSMEADDASPKFAESVGRRWGVLKQNKRESKALRRPAASLCMRRPAAGASLQLPQEETTVVSMEADDASPKFAESVVVRSVLQHMFASLGLSTDAVARRFELKFSREN